MFRLALAVIVAVLIGNSAMAQNLDCSTQRRLQIESGYTVTNVVSARTPLTDVYHQITDETGRSLTFLGPRLQTPESFLAYAVGLKTDAFIVETDAWAEIWGDYAHYGCWRFARWMR
jgi:hypothetical protein